MLFPLALSTLYTLPFTANSVVYIHCLSLTIHSPVPYTLHPILILLWTYSTISCQKSMGLFLVFLLPDLSSTCQCRQPPFLPFILSCPDIPVPHFLKFFSLDLRYQLLKPNKFFRSSQTCPLPNVQISINLLCHSSSKSKVLQRFSFPHQSKTAWIYLYNTLDIFKLPQLVRQSFLFPVRIVLIVSELVSFQKYLPLESDHITMLLKPTMDQPRHLQWPSL